MRFLPIAVGVVRMLVVCVVDMPVFVFQRQMAMQVRVAFREVQPHSCAHE